MKKLFYTIAAIAAAFTISSCAKDEEVKVGGKSDENADFHAFIGSADTRTTLSDEGYVIWDKSDRIAVNGAIYGISALPTPMSADFRWQSGDSLRKLNGQYYAFYPHSAWYRDSTGYLPASAQYSPGDISYVPMYSKSTDNTLHFKNIFALVKVNVEKSTRVSFVEVSGAKFGHGSFRVKGDSVIFDENDTRCDSGFRLECGDEGVDGTSFYIPVPPGKYTLGVKVGVYRKKNTGTSYGDAAFPLSTKKEVTLLPNTIYSVDFHDAYSDYQNALQYFADNVAAAAPGRGFSPLSVAFNLRADDIQVSDAAPAGILNFFDYAKDGEIDNVVTKTLFEDLVYVINEVSKAYDVYSNPTPEDPVMKQALAEMRVFRAYLQMLLTMGWGTPPLFDHYYLSKEDMKNADSQKGLYDWCVKECEEAYPDLSERKGTSDKESTVFVTKGFAWGVAGKCALLMEDNDNAIKWLKPLVESSNYALVSGDRIYNLFTSEGNGCEEKIFEVVPTYSDEGFALYNWKTSCFATVPYMFFGGEQNVQLTNGYGCLGLTPSYAKKFLENDGNSDRRKGTMQTSDEVLYDSKFADKRLPDGMSLEDKKVSPLIGISDTNGWRGQCDLLPCKSNMLRGSHSLYTTATVTIMRLAEAYLNYAEACIRNGNDAEAKKYISRIQNRAGTTETGANLEILKNEKMYEMWMEGCRWVDIVRWGDISPLETQGLKNYTVVYDEKFTSPGKASKLWYEEVSIPAVEADPANYGFKKDKHEVFPFPSTYLPPYTKINQNKGY